MAFSYTTPTLVERELRSASLSSSTTPTLATVQDWIEEESAYINTIAGQVFGVGVASSEMIDLDGEEFMLENAPIVSITAIEYNVYPIGSSLGSSWVTKTKDTDYTVYDDIGRVMILHNNWRPALGRKRVRASYTYGYTSTPLEVQRLATKLVAKRVIDSLLFENVNEGNSGGSVKVGPIQIVDPTDVGVGTYRQLTEDISELKKKVITGFRVFRPIVT